MTLQKQIILSASFQICKAFYRFSEAIDSLVRVAMLDPVAHTVLDMTLEHHLPYPVQRRFRGVYLCEHIFAGDVLVNHAVYSLNLPDYFFQSAVQVFRIHTLPHRASSEITRIHNNIIPPLLIIVKKRVTNNR